MKTQKRFDRAASSKPSPDSLAPHDLEAERAVLGAILLENPVIAETLNILNSRSSRAFYSEAHQHVFDAMRRLHDAQHAIDPITLKTQLTTDGTLEKIGGLAYISDLTGAVPTTANNAHYAELVKDAADRRAIITLTTRVLGDAQRETPVPDLLSALKPILDIERSGSTLTFDTIEISREEDLAVNCIFTGFPYESPGILAGPPGGSKTMLAIGLLIELVTGVEIFESLKAEAGVKRVLFFAGELTIRSFKRRVRDYCLQHKIDLELVNYCLAQRARIKLMDPQPLMELDPASNTPRIAPFYTNVARAIGDFGPDITIFDTFSRYYGLPDENSNPIATVFFNAIQELCNLNRSSVLFLDHTSKASASAESTSQVDIRGASGKLGAARWAAVLRNFNSIESEEYGISYEDRHRYSLFTVVKVNEVLAPPPIILERVNGCLVQSNIRCTSIDACLNRIASVLREHFPLDVNQRDIERGTNEVFETALHALSPESVPRSLRAQVCQIGIHRGIFYLESIGNSKGRPKYALRAKATSATQRTSRQSELDDDDQMPF